MARYIVVLSRDGIVFHPLATTYEALHIGPFRSRERAEKRAAVIRREAERYEDPEGVTGPDNALDVRVYPLAGGSTSAQLAHEVLYGSRDLP